MRRKLRYFSVKKLQRNLRNFLSILSWIGPFRRERGEMRRIFLRQGIELEIGKIKDRELGVLLQPAFCFSSFIIFLFLCSFIYSFFVFTICWKIELLTHLFFLWKIDTKLLTSYRLCTCSLLSSYLSFFFFVFLIPFLQQTWDSATLIVYLHEVQRSVKLRCYSRNMKTMGLLWNL